MTSGIYMMTNKVNGHRYIGYSENIEQRWEINIDELSRGCWKSRPLMQSDWLQNGRDAFCFGILEVLDTQEPPLLNRRAEYWKDLIKPEYKRDKENTEHQLVTHELAILSPVPEMHLKSGIKVCERESRVAFGCSDKGFFDNVDSLCEGAGVEVFIYASLAEQSIEAKVSWHAVYTGCMDALKGKHPEGDK